MLEGPARSGKTRLALAIAAAALCEGALAAEKPCGTCPHCRKILAGVHPDVTVLSGGGGSRGFHIEAVRTLRAQAYVAPNEASRRVYILQNVQEMTVAGERLLKNS
jgi:DNA polymerase-3 subunit delta'